MALTAKKALASVCGITERHVDRLAREGVIPKPKEPGNYDVEACLRAYIAFLRQDRTRYTGKELAAFLGISEAMVYKLHAAGMPQEDKGLWNLQDCVRWLIQHERDKRHKANSGRPLDDIDGSELARERLLAAREDRLLKQMAREERERTRIPREECEAGWTLLAGIIAAALEALPGRLAQKMADAETVLEARRGLFDEARRIRGEISAALAKQIERARGGVVAETPDDDGSTAPARRKPAQRRQRSRRDHPPAA